uniref:Uncharacterized protein n=1 Tax=Arundo donax TaxID=35708 RepID=A0A0A9CJ97_ARUDO
MPCKDESRAGEEMVMSESQLSLNRPICSIVVLLYIEQQTLENEVMCFLKLGFWASRPKETQL